MCQKCPFQAITIINLPKELEKDTTHRYGPNSFKLHRLPLPRPGQVLGLVGSNGTGKSTALKILSGKLTPNLGNMDNKPTWSEILNYFRGSELQNYFTKMLEDKFYPVIKPQYVDAIPRAVEGTVKNMLTVKNNRNVLEEMVTNLELENILERDIQELSGGELQRFAIATVAVQNADVYMFDEPSSYLDVNQRLKAARVIRSLLKPESYVICVEHDLAILDYLSDFICVLYGLPGSYGVVTMPFSVREGINIFLSGFIPTENLRFRDTGLNFKMAAEIEDKRTSNQYTYPKMTKTLKSGFKLTIEAGHFSDSEIIVMLGQNGTGKTTFIRLLAGLLESDSENKVPKLAVSYKPQKISLTFPGTVRQLLIKKLGASWQDAQFNSDVIKPLNMEVLLDNQVTTLSGGELQRTALTLCLGQAANVYLIDEPSAYLDSEQRIIAAKVIKRFIMHSKKTAFIVEHDFIMATYLADRVIVYDGVPSVDCCARSPSNLLEGMNSFLKELQITFRRDCDNFRPRINKLNSLKDKEQKASGNYFFLEV